MGLSCRLWVGTLGGVEEGKPFVLKKGSLYSFSETLEPTKWVSEINLSNGMAWSPDLKYMYYIDSLEKKLEAFDFNATSGEISNRRVVFDLEKYIPSPVPNETLLDGMTIDSNGNLWVAVFGLSGVLQIDPKNGQVLREVKVPSPHTTSVAFGGPALDELYVVSATLNLGDKVKDYPGAGKTFRITGLGVKGTPMLSIDLSKVPRE